MDNIKSILYQINNIGNLSDDDNYTSLIATYSHMFGIIITIYSCYPMIIDHKYAPLEFIQIMKSYNRNVDFEIIR